MKLYTPLRKAVIAASMVLSPLTTMTGVAMPMAMI